MHEVSTSRRAVMRALAIIPTVIAAPAAASAATGLACIPTDSQDPAWLALLAAERRAASEDSRMADLHDEAYDRFWEARSAFLKKLDDESGKPWRFIKARPAHEQGEERTENGIRDYNADCERIRRDRAGADDRLKEETGFNAADAAQKAAWAAHKEAIGAVVSFPSRDPDIIAHKLRLILEVYGDSDGLSPLLASIGEV